MTDHRWRNADHDLESTPISLSGTVLFILQVIGGNREMMASDSNRRISEFFVIEIWNTVYAIISRYITAAV